MGNRYSALRILGEAPWVQRFIRGSSTRRSDSTGGRELLPRIPRRRQPDMAGERHAERACGTVADLVRIAAGADATALAQLPI